MKEVKNMKKEWSTPELTVLDVKATANINMSTDLHGGGIGNVSRGGGNPELNPS